MKDLEKFKLFLEATLEKVTEELEESKKDKKEDEEGFQPIEACIKGFDNSYVLYTDDNEIFAATYDCDDNLHIIVGNEGDTVFDNFFFEGKDGRDQIKKLYKFLGQYLGKNRAYELQVENYHGIKIPIFWLDVDPCHYALSSKKERKRLRAKAAILMKRNPEIMMAETIEDVEIACEIKGNEAFCKEMERITIGNLRQKKVSTLRSTIVMTEFVGGINISINNKFTPYGINIPQHMAKDIIEAIKYVSGLDKNQIPPARITNPLRYSECIPVKQDPNSGIKWEQVPSPTIINNRGVTIPIWYFGVNPNFWAMADNKAKRLQNEVIADYLHSEDSTARDIMKERSLNNIREIIAKNQDEVYNKIRSECDNREYKDLLNPEKPSYDTMKLYLDRFDCKYLISSDSGETFAFSYNICEDYIYFTIGEMESKDYVTIEINFEKGCGRYTSIQTLAYEFISLISGNSFSEDPTISIGLLRIPVWEFGVSPEKWALSDQAMKHEQVCAIEDFLDDNNNHASNIRSMELLTEVKDYIKYNRSSIIDLISYKGLMEL